jgi:transposase
MAKPLIDDELWAMIEPLLPPPKPRRFRYPGRKPVDPRAALTGIVFVLKTGIPWEYVPAEMGISGVSCWRKLREWQRAGVWDKLVEVILARLQHADKIDWGRAVVDSSSIRAVAGGKKTGPSPVDRRKAGSKHHILVDGQGIPLVARVTKANRNDVTQLEALVDAVPKVRGKVGRPRRRPDELYADRAYDSKAKRRELRERGIRPRIARRKTPHGSGLGQRRWVVERSLAWLHQMRRLRTCFERSAKMHQAFLTLGIGLLAYNFL